MARKKTTEEFKKEVKDIWGDEYSVLEDYINNKTNILVIHNKCGNKYRIRPSCLVRGTKCAKCYGNKKKTTEEFKEEVYNLVGNEYELIGNYTGALKEITIKHNKCGRIYGVRANSFLDGHRCRNCSVLKMTKTQNEFVEQIFNLVGDEYTVVGNYVNNSTDIEMLHNKCNSRFFVKPSNFIGRNSRCVKCSDKNLNFKRNKTHDEFVKEVFDLEKDNYTVIGSYINSKTKIKIKHNVCNKIYEVSPNRFISGKARCVHCFSNAKNAKKTTEIFKQEIFTLVGNEYEIVDEYKNSSTKIKIKHNKCGKIYEVSPNAFLKGCRCPHCSRNKRKTTQEFKNEVLELCGNEYTVLGEYVNAITKIKIRHNKCGNIYMTIPNNFINKNKGCLYCSNLKMTKTQNEFVEDVFNLVGEEYTVVGNYVNVKTKITMKHNKCEKIYDVTPNSFLRGNRCPHCSNLKGFSNAEKELLDYITSILPNTKILSNTRSVISPKELDIYIPSLKIGIEYNGLYWHTEEYIDKNYHLDKTNECNKKGIKLIHIFEDEWLNNQGLMKNKIANLLGINNKTNTKDCYVREIKDNSDLMYGLYAKDNKSLSTLALCKTKKDGVYELLNYESNHNEVDDLDMILKYIKINNQDVNKIYTYVDLRFVDKNDNIYLKNGFKFISQSKPNYWYVVSGERRETANKDSHYKIYDCGNLKYEIDMK